MGKTVAVNREAEFQAASVHGTVKMPELGISTIGARP
jgi:hypothetical protein